MGQRRPSESGCCSLDDFLDARRVAEQLGIPFYVMDFRDVFGARRGRRRSSPSTGAGARRTRARAATSSSSSPRFWDRARELGADAIATGHYARVRARRRRRAQLLRGVDADKDQSYFLFGIEPAVLARTLFPVGGLRKAAVRAEAARRGLPVASKPDSQEVCFAPRGGYAAFVERHASAEPLRAGGSIVDARRARCWRRHDGVHRFTIGQRRGLGVGGGAPRYVTAIDAASGTVRVGARRRSCAARSGRGRARTGSRRRRRRARASAVKIRSRFAAQAARVVRADAERLRAWWPRTACAP